MSNDPLHGITLEKMLTDLVEEYGWEEMAKRIRINCFSSNPNLKSSLKFLRRTMWARNKVEILYKEFLRCRENAPATKMTTEDPPTLEQKHISQQDIESLGGSQ